MTYVTYSPYDLRETATIHHREVDPRDQFMPHHNPESSLRL